MVKETIYITKMRSIKALIVNGKTEGEFIHLKDPKLYTKPKPPVQLK